MKTVLDFYINSSIHVSLAVSAMLVASCIFIGTPIDLLLVSFVFLATIVGYNFIKYVSLTTWNFKSQTPNQMAIQLFTYICFIGLLVCIYMLPSHTQVLAFILAVITFLYVIPIWPKSKNLRSVRGLKIFIIGLVWAATVVLLPIWHEQLPLVADYYLLGAQVFFAVIGLTIPFEIRDLNYDNSQLRTLPQWLGTKSAKIIGILCFVTVVVLDFFKDEWPILSLVYWLFFGGFGILGVLTTTTKSARYITSFWIESIPIWAGLGLLLWA